MHRYKILSKSTQVLSPWVKVSAKRVGKGDGESPQEYHSIVTDDYVNVLGLTASGDLPLVRQYRPAIEDYSLELPGGLAESGENPAASAARELFEETGYQLTSELIPLGCLDPDSGRLENRVWCYFTTDVRRVRAGVWTPEPDVEVILMDKAALRAAIYRGDFKHAMHIATIGLALMRGCFSFD